MTTDKELETKDIDFFATVEEFFENGWTDGLPIVPPTESAVRRMLSTVDRDPQEVVGFSVVWLDL